MTITKKQSIKLMAIMLVLWITLMSSFLLVRSANDFFNTHYLQFNQIVTVILKAPLEIKKRVAKVEVQKIVLDYPKNIDTPIKKYICDKFGTWDCKTALAIAEAESGFRDDAININTNGTIDVGIFQINSSHFKQAGCSLKEVVDAYKNVDCAFSIWKASNGWSPWVTYNNGDYLIHEKI